MRRKHRISLFTFLVLAGLFVGIFGSNFAFAQVQVPGHVHASQSSSSATTGFLKLTGQVTVSTLPAAGKPTVISHPAPKSVRHFQQAGAAPALQMPTVASQVNTGPTGTLQRNFNGVSSLDSAITNFGAEFEPPDQGLCEGNGFVVEPVNSAFTIYHTNGKVVAGPFNVNALFSEGLTQFTSDPRCYYDKSTNTWFATILFISADNTKSHTDIAVNPSGDPTTTWTDYQIDTTNDGTNGTPLHTGCPCFGDQPLLGLDAFNLFSSTNEFSILGTQFNGAQIYAISKADLVSLSSKVHFVLFPNLTIGGNVATSIQPAITYGSANAEYFLNSLDPFGTFDNRLGVWAMTHSDLVAKGGIPTLSHVVITSEPYGVPPKSIQQGATSVLDSGDDRMMQVQFINGALWGALGTSVTIQHDTAARAGIAWFQVTPRLSGNTLGGATINKQGYVTKLGNYLIYPSIEVSRTGTATIGMTLSGPTFFPSVAYTVMKAGGSSFGPIRMVAAGTGPYDPAATRWGDYSAAVLDPTSNSIWMANEYIPPVSSQTPDGLRNWGTRVFEVSATI